MVYKRGLVELTKEERESKFCKALIEGKIITNYVFPRTKYVCGGCGEVSDCRGDWCLTSFSFAPDVLDAIISCDGEQLILTPVAILSHMQQCVPIAKLEAGESVKNSLLRGPDSESSVESKRGEKEVRDRKEGGKKEGRRKNGEEGTELEGEDGRTEDTISDAGSLGAVSVSGATAALLMLNASKSRRREFPSAGLDE